MAVECAPDPDLFAALLRAIAPAVSSVADDRMRMPACFHSFDQHPDDVRWLVKAFMKRYPKRHGPLLRRGSADFGQLPGSAARRGVPRLRGALCRHAHLPARTAVPALGARGAQGGCQGLGEVLIADDPPGNRHIASDFGPCGCSRFRGLPSCSPCSVGLGRSRGFVHLARRRTAVGGLQPDTYTAGSSLSLSGTRRPASPGRIRRSAR